MTEHTEQHTEQLIKTERRLFTYEEREQILKSSNKKCACCGLKLTTKTMTVEHIIPLHRGGTNDMENLTALCKTCNKDKGNILYLPHSFYSALIDTPRVIQMDNMVRNWFKTYKQRHDIERYPLIAPKHNTMINPVHQNGHHNKIQYSRQLVLTWTLISSEHYDEMEAISGTDLKTIRTMLQRTRPDTNEYDIKEKPYYEVYKPVTFYALRKLSNDKLLAIVAVRYDKDIQDMIVYLVWTDTTKSAIGMIADNFIGCAFDAIMNIAGEQIQHYMIMSNEYNAFDRYRRGRTYYSSWDKAEEIHFHDTISDKKLYALIVYPYNHKKIMAVSDFIEIPKWLEKIEYESQ